MKQCPICKKKYPDSEEFCPVHGVKLEEFKNSSGKAWMAAGAGVLSWFVLITAIAADTYGATAMFAVCFSLALSIFAVIAPRGSGAAFPKWCAYITGYLMIILCVVGIVMGLAA